MNDYIDEKIIPIKVSNTDESHQSLEEGYYISGRLETFSKEKYFEGLISVYIPNSFINMPDEVKEIKYPTNFRPDIIKANLIKRKTMKKVVLFMVIVELYSVKI